MSTIPESPFTPGVSAETLALRHEQYKRDERNARRRLADAKEAYELAWASALVAIPKAAYTTTTTDTRARKAEQDVLLSSNDVITTLKARIASEEDLVREAEDLCSDLAYFQRERQIRAIEQFDRASRVFSQAVDTYGAIRAPRAGQMTPKAVA